MRERAWRSAAAAAESGGGGDGVAMDARRCVECMSAALGTAAGLAGGWRPRHRGPAGEHRAPVSCSNENEMKCFRHTPCNAT